MHIQTYKTDGARLQKLVSGCRYCVGFEVYNEDTNTTELYALYGDGDILRAVVDGYPLTFKGALSGDDYEFDEYPSIPDHAHYIGQYYL